MRTHAETMPRPLVDALWTDGELPGLLNALARAANLKPQRAELAKPISFASMDAWIETACAHLGLEAEPLTIRSATLAATLQNAAPAIVRADGGYFGLVQGRRGRACLIAPDGSRKQIRLRDLESQLLRPLQEPIRREV